MTLLTPLSGSVWSWSTVPPQTDLVCNLGVLCPRGMKQPTWLIYDSLSLKQTWQNDTFSLTFTFILGHQNTLSTKCNILNTSSYFHGRHISEDEEEHVGQLWNDYSPITEKQEVARTPICEWGSSSMMVCEAPTDICDGFQVCIMFLIQYPPRLSQLASTCSS